MKFECGDLERALANPDWMPDAREHMKDCAACREEYLLWTGMSAAARQLHQEWESPELWPEIRNRLAAEQRTARRSRMDWRVWMAAAAAAAGILLFVVERAHVAGTAPTQRQAVVSGQEFLTEQALEEVEKNESAYRQSIEHLSQLAQPKLTSEAPSPVIASYREKLLMLDAAIGETRSHVAGNKLNMHLQTELAELYRDKRRTLEELVSSHERN